MRGKTHDLTQFLFHRFVRKRKIQSSDESSAVKKACSQVGRMDFQTKQYDYFAMRKKKPDEHLVFLFVTECCGERGPDGFKVCFSCQFLNCTFVYTGQE